jgi:hypothetical protein
MSRRLQRNLDTGAGSISVTSYNFLCCQNWSWVGTLSMSTVSTKYWCIWLLVLPEDETEARAVVTLIILPVAAGSAHIENVCVV